MSEIINPRTGERTPVELHIIDPIEREVRARVEALPDFTVTLNLRPATADDLRETFREGDER